MEKGELKIEDLVSETELADYLKVSRAVLLRLRSQGAPYVKIGLKTFYFIPNILKWVKSREKNSEIRIKRDKKEKD